METNTESKPINERLKSTLLWVAVVAVVALIGWFIYTKIKSAKTEADRKKAEEKATQLGTPEYYAQQIWDLGPQDWYDLEFGCDTERLMNLACQISRSEITAEQLQNAFQRLKQRDLNGYLSDCFDSEAQRKSFYNRIAKIEIC